MNRNIIIGGGGFALEMHSLLQYDQTPITGYLSLKESTNMGLPYLGSDEYIVNNEYENYYLAIGSIGIRKSFFDRFKEIQYKSFLSSKSFIANSTLGIGTLVYPNSTIFNSFIGKLTLINSNCSLGHDVTIGDFCNISPGCNIAGNVKIGNEVHLGIGSTIKENIKIGNNVLIGAHSNITKDIESNSIVYGNPARKISQKI